ncbi:MAG: hypothetical protein MMC23_003924 [Stictis urceolatum]|nr:hypothetical protein [Stictis urceolata]
MHDDVWIQLDRTLQSMLAASLNTGSTDYNQITFVYSAIVALHNPWLYPEGPGESDTDRSQRAKVVIQQITETINTNLVERQCFLGQDFEDVSPWGLFFAYHICGYHTRYKRGNAESIMLVKSLRETLLAIDTRWNVVGVYIQLLEAQEVIDVL